MELKLPEHFDIGVNLKQAVSNAVGLVLFVSLITQERAVLAAAFVFGLLGGSANDIYGFLKNKEAITSFKEKKEEGEE